MRVVVLSLVLVALSCFLAWLSFLFLRRITPDPRIEINHRLAAAKLTISPETWRTLFRLGERRSRWGNLGGSVGFGLGFMVSVPLEDLLGDSATMLALLMSLVGVQFGRALSSQFGVEPAASAPRMSGLQPHGFDDYLRRRYLVAQIICLVGGAAGFVAGATILLSGAGGESTFHGWLAASLGLLMFLVSTAALVCQRRLLRAPMLAENESDLVANDIALSTGLLDVTLAVAITLFQSGWVVVLSLDLPWWQSGLGLLGCVAVTQLVFDLRPLRADLTPVAHRLAGVPTP